MKQPVKIIRMNVLMYALASFSLMGCNSKRYVEGMSDKLGERDKKEFSNTHDGGLIEPIRITAGNESSFSANISPNDRYVVMTSDRNANKDIWEKELSGKPARQLTFHAADDFNPSISPKGKYIAFVSRRDDAAGDLYVMDTPDDGGGAISFKEPGLRRIGLVGEQLHPSWFPDESKLVFSSRNPDNNRFSLYQYDLSADRIQAIGGIKGADIEGYHPVISPDAKYMLYVANQQLWRWNFESDKPEQLTKFSEARVNAARFSDDGKFAIITLIRDDSNADGSISEDDYSTLWRADLSRVTHQPILTWFDLEPLTTPELRAFDGFIKNNRLYFSSQREHSLDIFYLPHYGLGPIESLVDQEAYDLSRISSLSKYRYVLDKRIYASANRGRDREALAHVYELAKFLHLHEFSVALRSILTDMKDSRFMETSQGLDDFRALFDSLLLVDRIAHDSANITRLTAAERAAVAKKHKASLDNLHLRIASLTCTSPDFCSENIADARGLLDIASALNLLMDGQDLLAYSTLQKLAKISSTQARITAIATRYMVMIAEQIFDKETVLSAYLEAISYVKHRISLDLLAQHLLAFVDRQEGDENDISELLDLRMRVSEHKIIAAHIQLRIVQSLLDRREYDVAANELLHIAYSGYDLGVTKSALEEFLKIQEREMRYIEASKTLDVYLKQTPYTKGDWNFVFEFYVRAAQAFLRQDNHAEARLFIRKALALQPKRLLGYKTYIDITSASKNPGSFNQNLANSEETQKTLEDAHEHLQDWQVEFLTAYHKSYALRSDDDPVAILNLIDDQIAKIETIISKSENSPMIYQTLGWFYFQRSYWQKKFYQQGSLRAKISQKVEIIKEFFGMDQARWLELAIDSYLSAFHLAEEDDPVRLTLHQNMAEAFYEMKNYHKALSSYLPRIKNIERSPLGDQRLEALLYQKAGRSAFHADELKMAASFQLKSLQLWESANNDQEYAYALDALALTLRSDSQCKAAVFYYEKLIEMSRFLKSPSNLANAMTNAAYCYWQNKELGKALEYFAQAKRILNSNEIHDTAQHLAQDDAVTIDLGGGAAASKGFDRYSRLNLIMSFEYKIYKEQQQHLKALEIGEDRAKMLLEARDDYLKQGRAKTVLLEELAVLHNQLAHEYYELKKLEHARSSYEQSINFANGLRVSKDSGPHNLEVEGIINLTKISLFQNAIKPVKARPNIKELQSLQVRLQNLMNEVSGRVELGDNSYQIYMHEFALLRSYIEVLVNLPGQMTVNIQAILDRDFLREPHKSSVSSDQQKRANLLLASLSSLPTDINSEVSESGEADESIKPLLDYPWRLAVAEGHFEEARKLLRDFIMEGGVLTHPLDHFMMRVMWDQFLKNPENPQANFEAIRDFIALVTRLQINSLGTKSDQFSKMNELVPTEAMQSFFSDPRISQLSLLVYPLLDDTYLVYSYDRNGLAFQRITQKSQVLAHLRELFAESIDAAQVIYVTALYEAFEWDWQAIKPKKGVAISHVGSPDWLVGAKKQFEYLPATVSFTSGHQAEWAQLYDVTSLTSISQQLSRFSNAEFESSKLVNALRNANIIYADRPFNLPIFDLGKSYLSIAVDEQNEYQLYLAGMLRGPDQRAASWSILHAANVAQYGFEKVNPAELLSYTWQSWSALQFVGLMSGFPVIVSDANRLRDVPHQPIDHANFYNQLTKSTLLDAASELSVSSRLFGYLGLSTSELSNDAEDAMYDYLDAAEDFFTNNENNKAISQFKKAAALARFINDQLSFVQACDRLTKVLYVENRYGEALHERLKVIRYFYHRIPEDERLLLDNYYKQKMIPPPPPIFDDKEQAKDADLVRYGEQVLEAAILAVRGKLHKQAKQYLDEAELIFKYDDDAFMIGKVYRYRGDDAINSSNYVEAIKYYETSASFYQKDDSEESVLRLLDIGNIYRNHLSEYDKALNYYDKAIAGFYDYNRPDLELVTSIDKANTLMVVGRISESIDLLLEDIIPLINKDKNPNLWIRAQQNLANAYFRSGKISASQAVIDAIKGSLELLASENQKIDRRLDAVNLEAMIAAHTGARQRARDLFEQAIEDAKRNKNRTLHAVFLNNYGYWLREFGEFDASLTALDEALQIDRQLKNESAVAYDLRNIAFSLMAKGGIKRAQSLLQESLKLSENNNLVHNSVYCYLGLGQIAFIKKQWNEAREFLQKSSEIGAKSHLLDLQWRSHLALGHVFFEEERASKLTKSALNDSAEMQFKKALALVDALPPGLRVQNSPSRLFAEFSVRDLYDAFIDYYIAQNKPKEAWAFVELAKDRVFKDSVASSLGHLKSNSSIQSTPAALQRSLRDDQVLIQFSVSRGNIYVWSLSQSHFEVKNISLSYDVLLDYVTRFRKLSEFDSSTRFVGQLIYKALIEPVRGVIEDKKRLIIVPDDELHFLPFAALPFDDQYLLDRFEISYLDSSAGLLKDKGSKSDLKLDHRSSVVAALSGDSDSLDLRLSFVDREIEALQRYWPRTFHVGQPKNPKQAISNILQKNPDILHIASHAQVDPYNPLASRFEFGPNHLNVSDLFEMESMPPLVVLSACETGFGVIGYGDDLISLHQSFLEKGTKTVVNALWRIHDVPTAVLMKRFYRYLADGLPPSAALRKAQLLVKTYFAHPAYWAGMKAVGG